MPIHAPLTKTLELFDICCGSHSNNNLKGWLARIHFIIGFDDDPLVTYAVIERCLCNPIFPPSGVSMGSIRPHCEEFNNLGPTTLALESNGKFNFLKCEINVYQLNLFKS